MPTLLAVAFGGAAGSVARYWISQSLAAAWGDRFGYGTLLVNVVGCFVLGLLAHGGLGAAMRAPWLAHPGLTAGLMGGLTTFSTFGYQTIAHLEQREWRLAAMNVALNVVVGCAAAAAGLAVSKWATPE